MWIGSSLFRLLAYRMSYHPLAIMARHMASSLSDSQCTPCYPTPTPAQYEVWCRVILAPPRSWGGSRDCGSSTCHAAGSADNNTMTCHSTHAPTPLLEDRNQ